VAEGARAPALRRLLVGVARLLLRAFFRRIEVVGEGHVPTEGPVVFALNHPSGLIDPLFILCLSGRRVSFLAKEPLFRTPVLGAFVRAFECLPVYRARDGASPGENKAMLEQAARLLSHGNAVAVFPEGTSHSDPRLLPLKTGAARLVLGAAEHFEGPVALVPAGLYYEQKDAFRSRAVLVYGAPLLAERSAGLPTAHELTGRLAAALEALVPTAETVEALLLAEQAERLLTLSEREMPDSVPLGERVARRRHLLDAYPELTRRAPERAAAILERLRSLSAQFERLGLRVDARAPRGPAWHRQERARSLLAALLLVPGTLGVLVHYPTHRLVRALAFRVAGGELDVVATAKLLGGVVLYPLTWVALGAAGAALLESPLGALSALLGPPLGWCAVRLEEHLAAGVERSRLKRARAGEQLDWPALERERRALTGELRELIEASPGVTAARTR
jgi:1-acyl-sn-glycerol-3-phosphate acyltransferase